MRDALLTTDIVNLSLSFFGIILGAEIMKLVVFSITEYCNNKILFI